MKRHVKALVLVAMVGCIASEVAENSTESEIGDGQGSNLQGSNLQGSNLQGSNLQGTSYDGASWLHTSTLDARWGSLAASYAAINGAALTFWTQAYKGGPWAKRSPDQICYYDSTRTQLQKCSKIDLATTPSPIAGSKWKATFKKDDGTLFEAWIQIGLSTNDLAAVSQDPDYAMFKLDGASSCNWSPQYFNGCQNPAGCRRNCDIWLYKIYLVDDPHVNGGQPYGVCNSGTAIAVPGTYSANGTYSPPTKYDSTRFTFSCSSGTIAKCTRWGFRPWGAAKKSCQTNCDAASPENTTYYPLVDLHQTCIRAAMADYCTNGTSYTRENTLVDIWDYNHTVSNAWGFVPKTRGGLTADANATAFTYESRFDKFGMISMDHERYNEVQGEPADDGDDPWNIEIGCMWECEFDVDGNCAAKRNVMRSEGTHVPSQLRIDSTTGCAHSERTTGKWLSKRCSACTARIGNTPGLEHCTDSLSVNGKWDSACVSAVNTVCGASPAAATMASHNECTTGAALPKFATGCTFTVCQLDSSCCNSSWTSTCVALANDKCYGGNQFRNAVSLGFCPMTSGEVYNGFN